MESKIKILYIDDEELNLTAFVRLFRRSYEITTASSAEEGTNILKKQSFHIILVDQRMPGTTGSEFFKEIADIYPESMRVLVTAYSDLNAVISAVNEGKIYKYVSKPYKKEEMIKVIENAYQVHHFRTSHNNDFSKYKEVFINSRDSIFLMSKNGKVIDANDSCLNLLQVSSNELINKGVEIDIFSKISMKEDLDYELGVYKEFEDLEATFLLENGEVSDCLVSLQKINIEGNEIIVYQGTIKNISKLKTSLRNSVKSLLEHKERENETVATVIHENSAQNLSGIHFQLNLLEKAYGSEKAKETLTEVKNTLVDTINELRDVCFQILPRSLKFGLGDALDDLSRKIEIAYQASCLVIVEDELLDTSKDFKVMIFRTIQNLLRGLEKENSELFIEISSDELFIYSEVTGKKIENNEEIIDQVSIEVDCYSGSITQRHAINNQTCYRMVFPKDQS